MAQLALVYAPSHTGSEAWQRQLEALRLAVDYLGRKEVAFELDISGSALGDALHERDRKRWAAEWTHVVKAMLVAKHEDEARALLEALCTADLDVTSFVLEEPRELTPLEQAAAFRAELARLGADGKAAIDRVLAIGKGRRK